MSIRIGHGIDIHQLVSDIPLVIGGVTIPHNKGSKGHSDGDVLYHAIVDSILGALSLGDIGKYFPSNNKKWQNANSNIFLDHTKHLLQQQQYQIINLDTTIVLQSPQIHSFVDNMKNNISKILNLLPNKISIKATTTDHLGFIGSEKGIMATSTILIEKNDK